MLETLKVLYEKVKAIYDRYEDELWFKIVTYPVVFVLVMGIVYIFIVVLATILFLLLYVLFEPIPYLG